MHRVHQPFPQSQGLPHTVYSEPWYNQFKLRSSGGKQWIACQEFHTISVRPQLQALYCEPEGAMHADYLHEERVCVLLDINRNGCLDRYSDVLDGTELIEAF